MSKELDIDLSICFNPSITSFPLSPNREPPFDLDSHRQTPVCPPPAKEAKSRPQTLIHAQPVFGQKIPAVNEQRPSLKPAWPTSHHAITAQCFDNGIKRSDRLKVTIPTSLDDHTNHIATRWRILMSTPFLRHLMSINFIELRPGLVPKVNVIHARPDSENLGLDASRG